MEAATSADLVKALRGLEKSIAASLLAQVRAGGALLARVEARWRAAEVGGRLEDWIDLATRRSAVRFLLRTVYVRVLEDTGALQPLRIRGDRGRAFFQELAPGLGIRSYLSFIFRDLALDFPALFSPSAEELPLPEEEVCRQVWDLWHERDGEQPRYRWDDGFDSRFLGDLYQDLDAEVRKHFALLQTPHFVERFILDRTLTPALAAFPPDRLAAAGRCFRLLDPTCGSGHFLIGAWKRLAAWWLDRGLSRWDAAARALGSVWGCDINAHAVDIARFRLLLEVVAFTGERDIDRLRTLPSHLETLDSLIPWERGAHATRQGALFVKDDLLSAYGTTEDRRRNADFLAREFHVVVGNPPYITPKDVKKRDDYRQFWPRSAAGKYALSAPFVERLFVLGAPGAFMGQITANSFMKREFGKKLVEEVFPAWDLTDVIDTSGAYIPGHGTPTVILIGRSSRPALPTLRAVLGKRGEPKRPDDPAAGQVWSDIARAGEVADDSSPFVTVAVMDRKKFGEHPWSIGGGESQSILEVFENKNIQSLSSVIGDGTIGNLTKMIQDDLYFGFNPSIDKKLNTINLVEGSSVRDYSIDNANVVLYPYEFGTNNPINLNSKSNQFKHFWYFKSYLLIRQGVGFKTVKERGQYFYEYPFYFPKTTLGLGIVFTFVSTHNHFVLDRGGKVFNRSAPIIKLPPAATEDDHLDLLGLLNSSALGFWMRQIFHCKGSSVSGDGARTTAEDWDNFYEYDSTKLQSAPVTANDRAARIALARALDGTAAARAGCLPGAVLAGWAAGGGGRLTERLAAAAARYGELTEELVALQEELDWLTYGSYGLAERAAVPAEIGRLAAGHRPFEILAARADEEAEPEERSKWWERHGHARVTEIPVRYTGAQRARMQARMEQIQADPRLQLLEGFAFKRRWQRPDLAAEAVRAAEGWLLDALEGLFAEGGALSVPRPWRLEEICGALQQDGRAGEVAAVAAGTADFVLPQLIERLLRSASMPDHPWRTYSAEGLRTRAAWQQTWAMQDREDAGEAVEVPLPPKYARTDFARHEYFQIRGKLDVPRERFIAFHDLGAGAAWGWNGWRDLQRATAQIEALEQVRNDPVHPLPAPSHDDPRRCGATLGLWASLDDVRRWVDRDTHEELLSFAQESCGQTACPCPLVERWQAWSRGALRLRRPADTADTAADTIVEQAAILQRLTLAGKAGLSQAELVLSFGGSAERLAAVLDTLVARGAVALEGRGRKMRYSAT